MQDMPAPLEQVDDDEEAEVHPNSPNTQSKRERLLMSNTEKNVQVQAKEQRAEKGCSADTFYDLVCMAKNPLEFIELCSEEASKRSGHTNRRKQFRRTLQDEKNTRGPWSAAETTAWRHRPQGCSSLKKALLIYGTEIKERMKAEKNPTGLYMLQQEFEQIGEALTNINESAAKSQLHYEFPGAFGFVTMQAATAAFRAEEDRRAREGITAMTLTEKYRRFPSLQPGYPDNMHGQLLAEEIEIRRLENGNGKRGLQQPDAPHAPHAPRKKQKQPAAAASSARAASPSLNSAAAPTAAAPADEAAAAAAADEAKAAEELAEVFSDSE